jgi:long-chain acyl-CoA synthetase
LLPEAGRLTDLLQRRARQAPFALACTHRDSAGRRVKTHWRELWQESERMAARFAELGLRRGDALLIAAAARREWVVAEAAGMLCGGVIVGVDPLASAESCSYVLEHSEAVGLVVDQPSLLECIPAERLRALRFVITIPPAPAASDLANGHDWNLLRAKGIPAAEGLCAAPIDPDEPAAIFYTSGTMGNPKAIRYTHEQLACGVRAINRAFPHFGKRDSLLCWLPMAHMFQRMMNWVAVANGATIAFARDPRQVAEHLRRDRPTVFVGVPRFYEKVQAAILGQVGEMKGVRRRLVAWALAEGARAHVPTGGFRRWSWGFRGVAAALADALVLRRIRRRLGGRLRLAVTGSAPLDRRVLEFFWGLGIPLREAYALSENAVPMAANPLHAGRPGSVGRLLPENDVRIEADGEILVRGPGVFGGYFKDPTPGGNFSADGYYRTGDCGCLDAEGFLRLTGRKSEWIKTSTGRRISPVRVESVYRQSPLLDQVVVLGNGRRSLSALLTLNVDRVAAHLGEQAAAEGPEVPRVSERARELIVDQLHTLGRSLAEHERVKIFWVLDKPLSVEAGELTPTLKWRRAAIERKYALLLDRMYDEEGRPPGEDRTDTRSHGHARARVGACAAG